MMATAEGIKRVRVSFYDPWGMRRLGLMDAPFNRRSIAELREDIVITRAFHAGRIWPRKPKLRIEYFRIPATD